MVPVIPERASTDARAKEEPSSSRRHVLAVKFTQAFGGNTADPLCLSALPTFCNEWAGDHVHQSYPMGSLRAQHLESSRALLPAHHLGQVTEPPRHGFPVCKTRTTVCLLQGFIVRSEREDRIALTTLCAWH